MKKLNYAELEKDIQRTYTEGVTLPEAEKLAAKFLVAQMQIAEQLMTADLDARMRKGGTKGVKATIFLQKAMEGEKKPSDKMLDAMVDSDEIVRGEQDGLEKAEVNRDQLLNYLNIFKEAHIFFRGISRGKFE